MAVAQFHDYKDIDGFVQERYNCYVPVMRPVLHEIVLILQKISNFGLRGIISNG